MVKALVEIRKQKSVGSTSTKFGGPDVYVAVQVVPEGVEHLKCLNRKIAEKRGIQIYYFGEGYSKRCSSPRAMFNRALKAAEEFAQKVNEK